MSDQQQPKPAPGPDVVHPPAPPEMQPPDVPLGVPLSPPDNRVSPTPNETPSTPNETPSPNPEEIPLPPPSGAG